MTEDQAQTIIDLLRQMNAKLDALVVEQGSVNGHPLRLNLAPGFEGLPSVYRPCIAVWKNEHTGM
jgi:hypothetical protein